MAPIAWQPPDDLLPYLEYTDDRKSVRCLACHGESKAGLGSAIQSKSLKKHLTNSSHILALANMRQTEATAAAERHNAASFYNTSGATVLPQLNQPIPHHHPAMFDPSDYDYPADSGGPTSAFDAGITAQLIDELDLASESTLSIEEKRRRIQEQFNQLLEEAFEERRDLDDGPIDVDEDFVSSELPKDGGIDADDEEDSEAFDFSALPTSQYWPYPSKMVMLLDIMDNLPRCRFSTAQLSLFLLFSQLMGMPDIPSVKGFRKCQDALRTAYSSTPKKEVSMQGNIFYTNDIRDTIARDFANPQVAKHLHLYPEENTGPVSETYQASRWKEFAPSELTPMFSKGFKQFWIEELAQLTDGAFVIPHLWIVRDKVLTSEVSVAVYSQDGWTLTGEERTVPASDYECDYIDLVARTGSDIHWVDGVPVSPMPNKLRNLVDDDEDLYVVMVSPWADDVSGSKTKQYNKHMNMYTGNGCLPGRLLQQEFHVHYISTSPHATSAEQFAAFRDQVKATETSPVKCFNAQTKKSCRVIIRTPGLPADNPQQSEEACHMGSNANFPCRKCHWGGPGIFKESDEGFHACHFPGLIRSAQEIRTELTKQLDLALHGNKSALEASQKASGTKDKVTQYWIEQLLPKAKVMLDSTPAKSPDEVAAVLREWLDEQPGDKMNPLLDITGLDPSQDTPVELLHTILLGIIKYIWHLLNTSQLSDADRQLLAIRLQSSDLSGLTVPPLRASYMMQYRNNLIGKHFKTLMQLLSFHVHDMTTLPQFTLIKSAGELGARLWVPEIDDMDKYLADLQIAIANVLDAFDDVDPLRIIQKIKIHLLAHIPDDVRRFGPAIRFSTEIYEAYNAVFRMCSIYSNHQAPSRDISYKFSHLERVKHIFTGGYFWDTTRKEWVQAGAGVLQVALSNSVIQRHLGWVLPSTLTIGRITPKSAKRFPAVLWSTTTASRHYTDFPQPDATSLWRPGQSAIAVSEDRVSSGAWVFALDVNGDSVIGRIAELLISSNNTHNLVTLERFLCGDLAHPEFGWPVLRRPRGLDITEKDIGSFLVLESSAIQFVFSVQHDCRTGKCEPTVVGHQRQEHEETTREMLFISHVDDDRFVVNMSGLHNFVELCRALPAQFRTLKQHHSDRAQFHREVASKTREIRAGKRKRTSEKRRATAEEKRKRLLDAEGAMARADNAVAIGVDVEEEEANMDAPEEGSGNRPLRDSDSESEPPSSGDDDNNGDGAEFVPRTRAGRIDVVAPKGRTRAVRAVRRTV